MLNWKIDDSDMFSILACIDIGIFHFKTSYPFHIISYPPPSGGRGCFASPEEMAFTGHPYIAGGGGEFNLDISMTH